MTVTATTEHEPTTDQERPILVHLNPDDLVIGTNVRTDPRLDKALIESIAARGVLQPVVAVRADDGSHVVRFGQRRTLIATQTRQPSIPVYVVPDSPDADRIIDQMAENDHRTALTPGERVAGYEQLTALGMKAGEIAKQTATTKAEVATALSIAASTTATEALRERQTTLDEAAVLAEFDGDPDASATLLAALGDRQFPHLAQRLRDSADERARRRAAADAQRAQGVTVLEARPSYGDTAVIFSYLVTATGEAIPEQDQRACPHYAVCIEPAWTWTDSATGEVIPELANTRSYSLSAPGWHLAADSDPAPTGDGEDFQDEDEEEDDESEDPASSEGLVHDDGRRAVSTLLYLPVPVCTDPAAHGYRRRTFAQSSSTTERPRMAALDPAAQEAARTERRDVINSNRAWDSAQKVRRDWLTTFAARKTPPKGTGAFLAAALTSATLHYALDAKGYDLAETLLGVGGNGASLYGAGRPRLRAVAENTTDQRGTVVALGMLLAAYEGATHRGSWRTVNPDTARYLEFIANHGYTLSPVEHRACGHPDDETAAV